MLRGKNTFQEFFRIVHFISKNLRFKNIYENIWGTGTKIKLEIKYFNYKNLNLKQ